MVNVKRLPMPIAETYEWQYDGLCRDADSETFFSAESERRSVREAREAVAKRICARCPVIEECREHSLAVPEPYGVWGGLTARERMVLVRDANRVAS